MSELYFGWYLILTSVYFFAYYSFNKTLTSREIKYSSTFLSHTFSISKIRFFLFVYFHFLSIENLLHFLHSFHNYNFLICLGFVGDLDWFSIWLLRKCWKLRELSLRRFSFDARGLRSKLSKQLNKPIKHYTMKTKA